MIIREFKYTDLNALVEIAKVSFADEYAANGQSPTSYINQIKTVTRGRMIPFRIISALAGIKWRLFVAEVDDQVVGCGSYLGRQQIELANLMVHPQYRRQGIGQALLKTRLQYIHKEGHAYAKTTVLASNEASLSNLRKQGFEVFDQFKIFETDIPLQYFSSSMSTEIYSRPVQQTDLSVFMELERQISNPVWLHIQGTAAANYFPSLWERLLQKFAGSHRWVHIFMKNSQVIGFLSINTSNDQTTGAIFRPVISQENIAYLPQMLHEASIWLRDRKKKKIRIGVPLDREYLVKELKNSGWEETIAWVQLVKWLNN
ncbi:MAG: GNAT family N-acetyltransferase [Ardenticatenaceae bacterium]|nr:GNAT family N-acetyltransferase [Ardenticatenaceae bacterium]